ncbi:hypothetical protein [Pelomonas cellulosilytica]|uniref:Cardiolipin synthase N-terminal domain-containing protein n=1 Tax=Pelomonas cellulosilytica TaxID=2906762 RepID=A0ABS8Y229_9BURK|nr:hypothetical protein [Pelomonas sp. P8]MCE4555885.1 hypothetical protein [Pelomonas sp. P8]
MSGFGLVVAMLGALLLYIVPALLAIGHVLRHDQPRIWFVVFLCMPLGGPLLYMLWPRNSASRPLRQ